MADGLRQGAQGHYGRQLRLRAMVRGPPRSQEGLRSELCTQGGEFIENLAPSGPDGKDGDRTCEGPDGAGFAWEL